MVQNKEESLFLAAQRIDMAEKAAARRNLIDKIKPYAPDVPDEHIEDVCDALWLLDKLENWGPDR